MAAAFDFVMNTTDAELGYAPDGNRLAQRWTWYSLHAMAFNGYLFDWEGRIADFGLNFSNYMARFMPTDPTNIFFQRGWTGYAEDCDSTLRPPESSPQGHSLWIAANGTQKALLQFDISLLPRDAEVVSATLSLVSSYRHGVRNMTVHCYGIKRPWQVGEATWTHATAGTQWQVSGCAGPQDREATPVSSVLFTAEHVAYSWD
jgi:hypothetical protein